jgi:peptide-methionine (S)-S-oxide reductase
MMHFLQRLHLPSHLAASLLMALVVLLMSVSSTAGFAVGSGEKMKPAGQPDSAEAQATDMSSGQKVSMEDTETAVLAGGCFWGVEAVFERLEGVVDVVSGYSGGEAATAKYQIVGSGKTGHAESVRIDFNPEIVTFETLLEVFFNVAHDPTQLNFQGPDIGTEYRSVVFYASDEQRQITDSIIEKLNAEGVFGKEIVTEVVPLDEFYPAEDYHQDFMRLNPRHPYIVYWDLPKIKHLEKAYPELLEVPAEK